MTRPFPPFIRSAAGAHLETIEGRKLLDFWQGHFCMIQGHNPSEILEALRSAGDQNMLLQLGANTRLEDEVAASLSSGTGFDQVIFATSGAGATMQAIMLALAHTRRSKLVKVAGGWHGAHPWSLKAVRFAGGTERVELEGAGVPPSFDDEVLVVPFNDRAALQECFARDGDSIGACIVELVLGNSGMIMAEPEYVRDLRAICHQYGAVLIVDELVTGYRVRPGCMYPLYGIEPDIVTVGKTIGGGMPFAAVAGRSEILAHASTANIRRVWADNGTFAAHPGSLVAARAALNLFTAAGQAFFSSGIDKMNSLRTQLTRAFHERGISAHVTGTSPDPSLPNFPIGTVRFLSDPAQYDPTVATAHWDSRCVDIELRDHVSKIALLLRGVHSWQGLGVVSHAHRDSDIAFIARAYEGFADDLAEAYDWSVDAPSQ